jgi:hypothetical protein
MTWPVVARAYMQTFQRASAEHKGRLKSSFQASTVARRPTALPDLNLTHLRVMTDDTGILQHAAWNVPRYEDGYCLDDNARALIAVTLIEDGGVEPEASVRTLATRYLAFVRHAFDAKSGHYRNFMGYDRRWTESTGSEDSHGRAIWATGTVAARSPDAGRRALATHLFHDALREVNAFTSPRAWAYILLGMAEYLRAVSDDDAVVALRDAFAARLLARFHVSSGPDWPWFEDRLTYSNARLSQALVVSAAARKDDEMLAVGLRSLEWLAKVQTTDDGVFAPVGSDGFYVRGGTKAAFDQQPVEACAMVSACLEAHRLTGQKAWSDRARQAFQWFLGQNQLQQWLYDASTGGCRDGLHASRPNENQGAESTLSCLLALMEMRLADRPTESQTLITRAPADKVRTMTESLA